MDQCEEVSEEQQQDGEQQIWDQSVLSSGSQGQVDDKEKTTQAPDEWDTDLETDNDTNQKQSLSCAELYLQACQRTRSVPVSSFLRHCGEARANLNHHGVGPLGAKALAIALQHDNVITHLELEDNALRPEGARHLMEMFQTNITIQSLNLSNNQLRLEGAKIISKMLFENYYIKSIKLSGNGFEDSAAKYLADAFEENSSVKELDLSHNMFCDKGGEHLSHMLATNVGLVDLNLSWNLLRMGGAVALSAGLKENLTLERLHLSWNGFGPIEAEALGQALEQNRSLVLLDLSNNCMDDHAVALFCQGLATNSTLRVLKLSHNHMTNTGALTLLNTVKHNKESAVEEIDISTVFVREAFVELFLEVQKKRPALDVKFSIMSSVTRNLSALQIFQKFLEERNESMMDFFQALDHEGTMTVSNSAFRKAVKAANVPLDQRQLEWLITKFDKNCSASIAYSQCAELS